MSRAFAWAVVTLRLLVVPLVLAGSYAAWHYLPDSSSLPDSAVSALLPSGTPAAKAEAQANQIFGSALLPRIAVVQRNPAGISLAGQRRIANVAAQLDRDELRGFPPGSKALPYLNSARILPAARERSTAVVTYLGFPLDVTPHEQSRLADAYARAVSVPGARAHATGYLPGAIKQADLIDARLPLVELATVLIVAGIIGFYLRSLLAPLVTLVAAGCAYLISVGVIGWAAEHAGLRLGQQVEPIVVVLLVGIVTDYAVFLLSGMRERLEAGEDPVPAARDATARVLPIIVTAALLVAAGLLTLRLASIGFVQSLGPAMAIAVVIALAVSITLIPAAMALLGRWLFWPGLRRHGAPAGLGAGLRRGIAHATSIRWLAVPTVVLVVAGLVLGAYQLNKTSLAQTPISALDSNSGPAIGAHDAEQGFAAGIIAPTEVVLRGQGIAQRSALIERIGAGLRAEPEVGGVIGPGTLPLAADRQLPLRSSDGNAIRYFVILRKDPYSSAAVGQLERLQRTVPRLLKDGQASDVTVSYAGETALSQGVVERVNNDLLTVGIAAALVNLLLLVLFLRSLVLPLLLVLTSALALAATFGVVTLVFEDLLGVADLTYFVPLAAGVLLLSFGTDYNLFIVGRIRQEARGRDTSEAIRIAVPLASRAITIAGLALALSFATLALIPVAPFRELALTIAIGVMIDTFLVRTLLIPALVALFGVSGNRDAPPRGDEGTSLVH